MSIRVVRLGSQRLPGEGTRLGTVRRPPRGVKKADYARRDFYDVWLPELSPSAPLVAWALSRTTEKDWNTFVRRYKAEMTEPAAQRLLLLLAAFSHNADFSVGCYCADERRCHRSVLRELLEDAGASVA